MAPTPPQQGGQGFVEYALMIILISIALLSILLIVGDDLRTLISDLLQRWFPSQTSGASLEWLSFLASSLPSLTQRLF